MSILRNDSLQVAAPKSVDSRYDNDGAGYSSVSQANANIIGSFRFIGLTVNVGGVEYWYRSGTTDGDLVIKSSIGVSLNNIADGSGNEILIGSKSQSGNLLLTSQSSSTNADVIFVPSGTGTLKAGGSHTSNIGENNDLITFEYAEANYGIDTSSFTMQNANETITGEWNFSGDLTVSGNLNVIGSTVQIDSQIETASTVIVLNDGEVGSGVTAGYSGLRVDRGTATNDFWIGFDEVRDNFTVGLVNETLSPGEIAGTKIVTVREDSPLSGGIATWNDSNQQLEFVSISSVIDVNYGGVNQIAVSDGSQFTYSTNLQYDGLKLSTIRAEVDNVVLDDNTISTLNGDLIINPLTTVIDLNNSSISNAGAINGVLISSSGSASNFLNEEGNYVSIPASVSQLSDLSDVNSSAPTNGNVLVGDGVDWESRALVEADISDFGNYLSGLTDGIGTTANGTAVNLGGDVDSYRQFNFSGTGQFLFDFGGGATIFSSGENFAIHTDSSGRGFTRNSSAEITTLDGSLGAVDRRSATGLTLQDYRAGASATGWEYGGDFTVNWTSDPSFDNFLATKKYVDDNNPSGSFQLFTDNASAGTYFLMPDVTSLPTPPNNSSYAVKIPIKAPASGTQNRSVISFSPSEAQNEFVSSVSEVFFGNTIVSQIDADSSKIEFWMPENESNLLSTSPYFILENSAVSGEKRIISSLTELQFSGFTINNTQITSGIVGTPLAISAQGGVSIEGLIYPSADGTNGQVLTTDGSGNLSFQDASGGSPSIGDGNINLSDGSGGWTSSRINGLVDSFGFQGTYLITGDFSDPAQSTDLRIQPGGFGLPDGLFNVFAPGGIQLDGPTSISSLAYPTADGTNGQILTTDGAGSLSFQDVPEAGANGSYTPTITDVANVSSSIAGTCYYLRVGDTVTMSISLDVTPTANNTQTVIDITLPIVSDLINSDDARAGINFTATGGGFGSCWTRAETTPNLIRIFFDSQSTNSHNLSGTAVYVVR